MPADFTIILMFRGKVLRLSINRSSKECSVGVLLGFKVRHFIFHGS